MTDGMDYRHGRNRPAPRLRQVMLQHGAGIDGQETVSVRTPVEIVPFLKIQTPPEVYFILRAKVTAGHIVVIWTVFVADQVHQLSVYRF